MKHGICSEVLKHSDLLFYNVDIQELCIEQNIQ